MKLRNSYLAIILAVSLYTNYDLYMMNQERADLNQALKDDIVTWVDKDSISHAKIEVLETEKTKTFIDMAAQDSLVLELQQHVHNYKKKLKDKGSVTIVKDETTVLIRSPTRVVKGDIEVKNDTVYVYPDYHNKINLDGWVVGSALTTKTNLNLDLTVYNDYVVVLGSEKQGLFKSKRHYAEVINNNPYARVKAVRTYAVSKPKKLKVHIGPVLAVQYQNGGFSPVIGFGLTYSLIQL